MRFVSLVLGLGLEHSCPWPRECLSSERLSLALALASDFFCVLGLGLGLEPCVLDSTSDNYLLRFERFATVAGWEKEAWATQLSPLLSGRALEVNSSLSQDETMDYERLKLTLLKRYDFTEFGYRRRFRDAKPEEQESPGQFIVRLKNYLIKWVKLAKVEESFDGVVELMVREQFTNASPKELLMYLNERSPKTLDELVTWAE